MKIWNQLSLLASVAVQHPSLPDETTPHVSVTLSCGSKLEDGGMASEVNMQIDVQPPESVWCARFTGLRIHCNFSTIQVQAAEPNIIPKTLPVTPLHRNFSSVQPTNSKNSPPSVVEIQVPDSLKKALVSSRKGRKPAAKTPLSKEIMLLDKPTKGKQKNKPASKTHLLEEITLLDGPIQLNKRSPPLPKTPHSKQIMLLNKPIQTSGQVLYKHQTPVADTSDLHAITPGSSDTPRKPKSRPPKKQTKRKAPVPSPDPFIKQEIVETPDSSFMIPTPSYKRQKLLPETPTPKPVSKLPGKKGVTAKTLQNHEMLRSWVEQNRGNPYPTKVQMQTLLSDTGYSKGKYVDSMYFSQQLTFLVGYLLGLLAKFRTSVLATIIKIEPDPSPPPEIPPSQLAPIRPPPSIFKLAMNMGLEDEMLLDENDDAPYDIDNDDMLLDPRDESLPWFDSKTSPVLLPLSPSYGAVYYELETLQSDHPVINLASIIPVPVACQLAETALRFLVGGEQRHHRGVKASPVVPELSLSLLIPSLFDSGFTKLMAQNARFLPTIIAAMCGTLVRNKQGTGLRKKLFLLAFAAKELDEHPDGSAGTPSTQRKTKMQDVVQKRLWSMMHQKLQDPHRARNLRHTTSDGVKNQPAFENDEDLFAGLNADYDSQDSQDSQTTDNDYDNDEGGFRSLLDGQIEHRVGHGLGEEDLQNYSSSPIFDDETEEFRDLFLLGDHDDEGLISYLDGMEVERERREIQRETEEMLLVDFPDEDDMLLTDFSADAEDMLLNDRYFKEVMDDMDNIAFFVRTRSIVEAPLGIGWR